MTQLHDILSDIVAQGGITCINAYSVDWEARGLLDQLGLDDIVNSSRNKKYIPDLTKEAVRVDNLIFISTDDDLPDDIFSIYPACVTSRRLDGLDGRIKGFNSLEDARDYLLNLRESQAWKHTLHTFTF